MRDGVRGARLQTLRACVTASAAAFWSRLAYVPRWFTYELAVGGRRPATSSRRRRQGRWPFTPLVSVPTWTSPWRTSFAGRWRSSLTRSRPWLERTSRRSRPNARQHRRGDRPFTVDRRAEVRPAALDAGLVALTVEGWDDIGYAVPDNLNDRSAAGHAPRFVGPFDNLIWHRPRVHRLAAKERRWSNAISRAVRIGAPSFAICAIR